MLSEKASGAQPAEVAHDCRELRASAAGRLRPADPCGIDFVCGQVCRFGDESKLRPAAVPFWNRKFRIQD